MVDIISVQKKSNNEGKTSSLGLSTKEARASADAYGKNIMTRKKRKSFLGQFISNLGDPVIRILIAALLINILFMFREADWFETGGIAISVFLATLISTLSEYSSAEAFERLSEQSVDTRCRVYRDGELRELDIGEIVVADVVSVGAGEQIPADAVLIRGELCVDQSAMTGESREIYKRVRENDDGEDFTPSSPYFCLRGCTILSGNGLLEVKSVGDQTFLGGISREIQSETRESPLRIRLQKLAKQISIFGYIAAILIALAYLFNTFVVDSAFDIEIIKYKLTSFDFLFSHLFHALTLGLTVIVVAVPEGLPMMIAVVLSSNIKRMVKDNVLVVKPVGIEAAGSMNILFTDKTGTLTEGKLEVGSIYLGDGREFQNTLELSKSKAIFADYALNAVANTTSEISRDDNGKLMAVGGNSTDKAILSSIIASEKIPSDFEIVSKQPFDSENKYSCVKINRSGKKRIFVKGAPEKILPYISFFADEYGRKRNFIKSQFEVLCRSLTSQGKRILIVAEAENTASDSLELSRLGTLTFLCMLTLEDKIRPEAADSVAALRRAGIHVVMITGDNKETATYIAKKCGIIGGGVDISLSGEELARMSDIQIKENLSRIGVVARALPTDKSRLVRISQELDLVVGMTGDGINDAPALKRADVGFSMGGGTQVAKDAGDIIILDNNLSSIVKAVLYGRNIFKSIRKFISLQLTMNFCAVGVSMICPFLGVDSPVTVVQMLWINIIMDTLGGLAFAGEGALMSCMAEKPKRRDESILNKYMVSEILLQGGFTIALCIAFLKVPEIISHFRFAPDNIYLLTAFFALFIFASVFNCFNARTDRLNLFSNITKNCTFIVIMAAVLIIQIAFVYLGGAVLRTAPLKASELAFTFVFALLVFPADFIRKLLWRLLFGKQGY